MRSILTTLFAIFLNFQLFGAAIPIEDADFQTGMKNGEMGIAPIRMADGETSGLKVTIGPCKEKLKYAGMTIRFKTPVDFESFKRITFIASANAKVHLKLALVCTGGRLDMIPRENMNFLAAPLSSAPTKCEFKREAFKETGTPALSKVEAFELGFGLWDLDMTSAKVQISIDNFNFSTNVDPFVIPQPTTGVSIDGQYKDWGYENVLYIWTPPPFLKLNAQKQLLSDASTWMGPEALSGKFSFMMDDRKLYFLAVVADSTPFSGAGANPWENDSIELFLSFDSDDSDIEREGTLHRKGVQIAYDCHDAGKATFIDANGRRKPDSIETKIIPQTVLIDGRQCQGYVLESAIPIDLLPVKSRVKGMPLAFSIKLNDSESKATLCATPGNREPFKSIASFKRAFIEIETERRKSEIKFGKLAVDTLWPKQYSSAKEQRIWDMDKAWKDESPNGVAERICLNSLWAAQAVDDANASPDPGKWVYVPCPMGIGWAMPGFKLSTEGVLSREENALSLLGGLKKSFFWYERTFDLPADVKDRKVYLNFEYIDKDAEVYVNGTFAGKVSLLNDRIEIARLLKADQPNRLDFLLYTLVSPGYSVGNGRCGVTGDIYLELRKNAPQLDDIWVKNASGLDGSFDIEVKSPKGSARQLKLEISDCKDSVKLLQIEKTSNGGEDSICGVLKDFKPWSPESPALYNLHVALLENGSVIDERTIKFGFRTFAWNGSHFLLNGRMLRLRAISPEAGGMQTLAPGEFRKFKDYGYNAMYFHSDVNLGWNDPVFSRFDEEGFVTITPMGKTWPNELTEKTARLYRNHPSVLAYVSDSYGQISANGWGYNPFAFADDYYPESDEAKKIYRHIADRFKFFKSLDPTRPYISHATGNMEGSFKNTHHYPTYGLTMIDRLMYYAPWAQRPDPSWPHYVYESGVYALHSMDSLHPDFKYLVSTDKYTDKEADRLTTRESASRYIGTAAFDNWRLWDAMEMKANLRGYRISGIDGFVPWADNIKFLTVANSQKPEDIVDNRKRSYEDMTKPFRLTIDDSLMRQNSWHYSLRAQACWQWPERYGLGAIEERPTIFTALFLNEMQPFFACVGGRPENVYSWERNYFAGESIDKTIIARNDTEKALSIDFKAIFSIAGKEFARNVKTDIAQGGIIKIPLSFTAPDLAEKTSGAIKLEWTMPDGKRRQDIYELTVFPKMNRKISIPSSLKIADVASPDGTSLLAKMGISFVKSDAISALKGDAGLVVFERNALSKDVDSGALKSYLERGGKLLILEQTDSSLFDWRLRERRLETLFTAAPKHSALKGLDSQDLSFLRGPDDMIPAEHRPSAHFRHGLSAAMETPHLSNEGIDAAYVMDKPSYGNFLPIIVGGFDLEEAALLEFRSGKGVGMLCQVDISGRYGKDPAATLLARNLVESLTKDIVTPKGDTLYIGGAKGADLLGKLGIRYSSTRTADCQILIVGDDVTLDKALADSFKTVVVLPFSNYLPPGVVAQPVRLKGLDYPYYWNPKTYGQFDMMKSILPAADRLKGDIPSEFDGLVDNDLYFFDSPELKAYSSKNSLWSSKFSVLMLAKQGDAKTVLCSVDPGKMKSGETRKKAYRVWSLIFANLGVGSTFEPSWRTPPLDLSTNAWTFLSDPDGSGEKSGFQNGVFNGREPKPILIGKTWEDQGFNEVNPNMKTPADSQYDGFAWYFTKAIIPADIGDGRIYFHADGVKDIPTYNRTDNQTDLYINGQKMPPPSKVYNAFYGGNGARLWELDAKVLKKGAENFIAIRIFNGSGPAGLVRKPVRFEFPGQNQGMLFPYEFQESKYTPYFFWSW